MTTTTTTISFYRWLIPHCTHPKEECDFSHLATAVARDESFPDTCSKEEMIEYVRTEMNGCECCTIPTLETAFIYYERETGIRLEE